MDPYYRCNWFLKAFGDLSFTSKDYFDSILLLKSLKERLSFKHDSLCSEGRLIAACNLRFH